MNPFAKHHLLGGSLLVAGMSIGVGMLALPVVTAAAGFLPSFTIYLICWFIMVCFARLILEACLWMPNNSNMISLSKHLLGNKGAAICWALYLFLFYCLMTAHIAAGEQSISLLTQGLLRRSLSTLIYVGLFVPVVYLGTGAVSRVNGVLMAGVILTYLTFFIMAIWHIDPTLLKRHDWPAIWPSLPVILTAFGFQNLIPTLYNYMDRDHKVIRKAIWIGTLIPLVLYVVWEFLILGIALPEDLFSALKAGQSAIIPLQSALQNSKISLISEGFAFFAMSASFVGISIAFLDFWADGLKWKKKGAQRNWLLLLVFGIPLVLVFFDPMIFLTALRYAGGIGMILLFGLLPILFVWSGRYIYKHSRQYEFVKGGKISLFLLFLFILLILSIMVFTE
jgi:tyrosine-specific transport protein